MNEAKAKAMGPNAAGDTDDFFVGYLPTPARLSRWLRRVVMVIAAVVVMTAAIVAALQNDPGAGAWALDDVRTWEGVLIARPYPMLRVTDAGGPVRTLLLVSEGKRGCAERLPAFDCALVRIKGTLLERDGRQMIELLSADDGFELLSGDAPDEQLRITSSLQWREAELRGEIIDPKCRLGAMKPGEGKTHKACAALCLRGGIPPMFVSAGEADAPRYHLLVADAHEPIEGDALDAVVSLVGDAVRVKGETARWGDVELLKVRTGDVVRE